MAKPTQATKSPSATKAPAKAPSTPQQTGDATLADTPAGLLDLNGVTSRQGQADRLGNARLQAIQRQMLANKIGQTHGNGHLQQVIIFMKQSESANSISSNTDEIENNSLKDNDESDHDKVNYEEEAQEAQQSFTHMAAHKLGIDEGYVAQSNQLNLTLPTDNQSQKMSTNAFSGIATAVESLRGKNRAVAMAKSSNTVEQPTIPEKPQNLILPEEKPEAVAAEIEASVAPVAGVQLPVAEISKPGAESEQAISRLHSINDVVPGLVTLGEAIHGRMASLREYTASKTTQASTQLQNEAAMQRSVIRSSMGASQQAVNGIMATTHSDVRESVVTSRQTLLQQTVDAHARNEEIIQEETTGLQESLDSNVEEAQSIFQDADEKVRTTGESEAQRGRGYTVDLAQRALEMGRSEAARYRNAEEDEELGQDKAEAVMNVASRFASQLERDGNTLFSDVIEQTSQSREQITSEEEPVVTGLREVAPGAVESLETYLRSVDDGVDGVIRQGHDQLNAAEAGAFGEIDNLRQAAQGRGMALRAEGEANLDATLTAGLLAQTNLAAQAGQLLDNTGRDAIDQLVAVGASNAPDQPTDGPMSVQRQSEDTLDAGVSLPGGVPESAGDEVLNQLDQVGPSLDQAVDSQTTELTQSLGNTATGTAQVGNTWVGETQGNMARLADVADTGVTNITDGVGNQIETTLEQGQSQAATEADRISDEVAGNVGQVQQSVGDGVSQAVDSLRGGVNEGNTHADGTFAQLPGEMNEAARSQESLWGQAGHWISNQLADTWEAIKGMADWGFILDLAIGIAVGVLVALVVAALIGTGVGALLVAGALAGAAGFAAGQMSANVRHGDPLFKGVDHAAILGAFVGVGGAIATIAGLGLLAGTGLVMLAAGLGTVMANKATGREWDDHLLATVLIVGVFHSILKPVMDRVPIRLRPRRSPTPEEPPGQVPSRPEPNPSETPPVGISAKLQSIRSGLTDPRAIEAFDAKFENLGRDSARMERIIEAMEQGGGVQDRLISEWERAHPIPRGPAIDEIPGIRNRAENLRTEIEQFINENPEIQSDLRPRINAEIQSIERMLQGQTEATAESATSARGHLDGIEGELRTAQQASGVTGTGRMFPLDNRPGGVEIDVVANKGRIWIDAKTERPFGLNSSDWAELQAQAARQLRAAEQNPIEGTSPRIIWQFHRGVSVEVATQLRAMGITVQGQLVNVPLPAIPVVPVPDRDEEQEGVLP